MNVLHYLVNDAIPTYLKNVPIPESFSGIGSLSLGQWAQIVVFGASTSAVCYVMSKGVRTVVKEAKAKCARGDGPDYSECVNKCLQKACGKVVDTCDIEDVADKKVYCRCWKSKKFPLCDGSHALHNSETGDNVGPLIVKRQQ